MAVDKTIKINVDGSDAIKDLKKVSSEVDATFADLRRTTPITVYKSEICKITKKTWQKKYVRGKAKVAVDLINHPPHYLKGGIEAIDVIEAWKLPFHLANVIKYICRAGDKRGEQASSDLKKAKFYLDRHMNGKEV